MNIILLGPDEISDGEATLNDHRGNHIIKVLRSKVGDSVRIGIINGPMGTGVITRTARGAVTLEIKTGSIPPPPPPTALILALPRPIMLKRVLAQAASLGIESIQLIKSARVEKSYFSASTLKPEAITRALTLGLEQAVDTLLPEVSIHRRFRPFVEDFLPGKLPDSGPRLLAHPDQETNLGPELFSHHNDRTIIAIGPEGGWVDFEIACFKKLNFTSFTMGPRILRVDTAVPAILSQLALVRRLKRGR